VIDRYIDESKNPVLGTKAQGLKTIKNSDLGETKCSDITSHKLVSFARNLTKTVEPQTCGNYFSHLSNIFTVARPAWGYPPVPPGIRRRRHVKKLGLIRKDNERNRRPSLEEEMLYGFIFRRALGLHNRPIGCALTRRPLSVSKTRTNHQRRPPVLVE